MESAEFIRIVESLFGFFIAVGGVAFGAGMWLFRRGKKEGTDEACIHRIEQNLGSFVKKFDSEVANTNESHRLIHARITDTKKDLTEVKTKVDSMSGKLDIIEKFVTKKNS